MRGIDFTIIKVRRMVGSASLFNKILLFMDLLGKIDICVLTLFCTKFNSEQLLFKSFLDVMHFFGSIQP